MKRTLCGRTAVISGAADWKKQPMLKELTGGGMNVVILTHQMEKAQEIITSLGEDAERCIAMPVRVNDAGELSNAYAQIKDRFGSIDVIIPMHGKPRGEAHIEAAEDDALIRDYSNRVAGSYDMLRCALPYLRTSAAPRVIFLSGEQEEESGADRGVDVALSEGAIRTLTRIAARQFREDGIKVNCIVMTGESAGQAGADRFDSLEEAVSFLAGEESGIYSGTFWTVGRT